MTILPQKVIVRKNAKMVGDKMSQSFPAQWTSISVPPGVDSVLDILPKSTTHARAFINGINAWWNHRYVPDNPYDSKIAAGFYNAWDSGWHAASKRELIVKTRVRVDLLELTPAGKVTGSSRKCPCTGNLCQIMVNFPPGCCGLVQVKIWYLNNIPLFPPGEGFLAMDTAIPAFDIGQFVLKGDEISMQVNNRDTVWPHTIAAACFIEYEGKWQNEEAAVSGAT